MSNSTTPVIFPGFQLRRYADGRFAAIHVVESLGTVVGIAEPTANGWQYQSAVALRNEPIRGYGRESRAKLKAMDKARGECREYASRAYISKCNSVTLSKKDFDKLMASAQAIIDSKPAQPTS